MLVMLEKSLKHIVSAILIPAIWSHLIIFSFFFSASQMAVSRAEIWPLQLPKHHLTGDVEVLSSQLKGR